MVRIAIIGCGEIAQKRHIPACLACRDAELAGFYNRTPEKAARCTEQFGGAVYPTPEAAFQDPLVDAVILCTPTGTHAALAAAAMRAGKHVLCEKPMACTAAEARKMLEIAEATGMLLMPAHNQRRYPAHRQGAQWLAEGRIGRPLSFRTVLGTQGPGYSRETGRWYFQKQQSGRGVVSDIGVHRVDLLRSFFGEVRRVFAYTPTLDKRDAAGQLVEVDDNTFALLEFCNGVVGSLHTSWTNYGEMEQETKIFGTEGTISMYGRGHDLELLHSSGESMVRDYEKITAAGTLPLTDLCGLFVQSIETKTIPPISGLDGLRAIEIIDAMEQSNREGRWISLPTASSTLVTGMGGIT